MKWKAIILGQVAIYLSVGAAHSGGTQPIPVRPSPNFMHEASKSELRRALHIDFEQVSMGNDIVRVDATSPAEFLAFVSAGLYSLNPIVNSYDEIAKSQAIAMLLTAAPAQSSYVGDFTLSREDILNLLPLTLHHNWDDYSRVLPSDQYYSAPPRRRELIQRFGGVFTNSAVETQSETFVSFTTSPDCLEERVSDDGYCVRFELELLAWGDFNQDGFEDVLVSCRQAALPGTLRMVNVLALSKLSPDAPLIIVSEFSPEIAKRALESSDI